VELPSTQVVEQQSPPSQHGLTLFAASHWPSPTLAWALASAQSKHLRFAVVPGTSLQYE